MCIQIEVVRGNTSKFRKGASKVKADILFLRPSIMQPPRARHGFFLPCFRLCFSVATILFLSLSLLLCRALARASQREALSTCRKAMRRRRETSKKGREGKKQVLVPWAREREATTQNCRARDHTDLSRKHCVKPASKSTAGEAARGPPAESRTIRHDCFSSGGRAAVYLYTTFRPRAKKGEKTVLIYVSV